MSIPNQHFDRSASGRIRKAYQLAKKPTAYILLVLTLVSTVYPQSEIQIAALIALAALVLEVIFDIQKHIASVPTGRVYSDFYQTTESMRNEISRRIEEGRPVSIRALGISMGHAWTFLTSSVTSRIQKDGKQIDLQIAMINPAWEELSKINADWVARARTNYEEIERHASLMLPHLKSSGSSISLSVYSHMPNWHGVLIDDDILFLSACKWSNDTLFGGENRYEIVLASDTIGGYAKIDHFRSWFDYVIKQPTTKRWE